MYSTSRAAMQLATGCVYRTYHQKTPERDNLKAEPFAGPCLIYHDEGGEEEAREALIELSPSRLHNEAGPYFDPSDAEYLFNDEESITYSLHNILQLAFEEQDNPNTVKIAFVIRIVTDIKKLVEVMRELQRRVTKKEGIPQSILNHIDETGQFEEVAECYWPSNWMTYVFLSGYRRRKKALPPEQLWFLPNVERLFLDCFDMKEVPELIGRLQRLKVASFAFNKLEHLPRRMRFCKQLEELSVVHNHMNCLPKWLTKFPNFRHLKRTDMFIIQTSDKVPIRRIVAENDSNNVIKKNEDSVVYCPESLFLAASKAALKAHPYLGFPTSARDMLDTLPRTVMDALTFFVKEMKFCDHCEKPFFKEEYEMITKNLKEWRGYIHVPIEAVACSDVCADAIVDEWTSLHDKEEQIQEKVCFDVEGSEEVLKRLWKHRKQLQKQRRVELRRSRNTLLCCC